MLRRISIENYALIDSLEIEFHEGLNTITGETGAGKSLLLGALSFVMGGRTDASIVRNANKPCVTEAEFSAVEMGLEPLFAENDMDYDDSIVIRRVITSGGKTRSYVNELPATTAFLKTLGERLIDIHSQHQSLLLGSSGFQTETIDSIAGHQEILNDYSNAYKRLKDAKKQLDTLRQTAEENKREEDYLRYQYSELTEAALIEGELEELEVLLNELTHASEIKAALLEVEKMMSDDESGVLRNVKTAEHTLSKLGEVFPAGLEMAARMRGVYVELGDLTSEIASEGERVDIDPTKLEKTEARLDRLYSLQQKHKASGIEELISIRDSIGEKLAVVENSDAEIAKLSKEVAALEKEAMEKARRISTNRKSAVPKVEKHICETTAGLGMPDVKFIVNIASGTELTPNGIDTIEFLFSANKNIQPRPAGQIASGGEISRLMLALKSLIARHGDTATIFFDEIDTGISGEIADKTGQIIRKLSEDIQVLNITHLPQIASKGEHHYFVYKENSAGATNTRIKELTHGERVEEIAKMLSGSHVTQSATDQAKALLSNG